MEEMQILMGELNELNGSLEGRDINTIGIIELRRLRKDFEALHDLNLELQERVRFDRSIDVEELRNTLNLGDQLWEGVGNALKPVIEVLRGKAALAMAKTKERRAIIDSQTKNRQTLDSLRTTLESTRSLMALNHDENAKSVYDSVIAGIEGNIKSLEELDASYAAQIERLDHEIDILRFGGSLEELKELEEETTGLTEEQERQLTREKEAPAPAETSEEHHEAPEEVL